MLIRFDFRTDDFQQANRDVLSDVIRRVLLAHRSGHHLAVLTREQGRWIGENLVLDGYDGAALKRVIAEYPQTGDLLRRATKLLSISPHPLTAPQYEGNEIRVALDKVSRRYLLDRVALLVEDIASDGKFYSIALKAIAAKRRMPPVTWETKHGGGGRIREALSQVIEEERIACAIVDRDHSFPIEAVSKNVRHLTREVKRQGWPFVVIATPQCREVDNLIPLAVLRELMSVRGHPQIVSYLERLEAAENTNGHDTSTAFILWVDLKNGIVEEKLDNDGCRPWYEAKLALAGLSCSKVHWPGLGNSLISQALGVPRLHGEIYAAMRSKRFDCVFGADFDDLLWCCASRAPFFS